MNVASLTYRRELLAPSESVDLFFKHSKQVQLKDLVAQIRCYDDSGKLISELTGLPYSRQLANYYVYLRSPLFSTEEWTRASISATSAIKSVEVNLSRWSKDLNYNPKDAVLNLLVGASRLPENLGQPANFVSIRGK